VNRDTPVSRTPTVAPGSLARRRALWRERRARGPQKLLGPPMARVNARSEDHMKIQRPRTRGAAAAGETKWRATLQSPRRQTIMMARRFTAEHCANASIPALRFDALTPAAPLNTASSRPLAPHLLPHMPFLLPRPQAHGSLRLLRRWTKLRVEMPRTPPGQQQQDEGSCPVDARCRRPPAHRRVEEGRGEPRHPGGLRRPDPSGSCAWRRSELAITICGGTGSPLPEEH
jgi:hypothetical protein